MNIYILESVSELTGNYHSGGGLVVIAKSLDSAKQLVDNYPDAKVTDEEWATAIIHKVTAKEENVFIFPDAGCC